LELIPLLSSGIIRPIDSSESKTLHLGNIMALSNLTQKAFKIETIENKEDSLFLHDQLKKGHEAVLGLLSLLNRTFVDPAGMPHAATILSAAAWLTGGSLSQSFLDQKHTLPGTTILPEDVSKQWEHLVYLLEFYNFQRADVPVGRVVLAAMAAPVCFKPQVGMSCVQSELQERYAMVMKQYGFNTRDGAHVGVMLCSLLIQEYSQAALIDIDAATGVVAQGIFEAARQCLRP
jgi:hypothetical protein